MIFNQFSFLFLFLPLVLAAFFAPGLREWRHYTLIIFSFFFYGVSGMVHAAVLMLDILWVYAVIRSDLIVGNKLRLTLAITPPFLALFYYKYLGFFTSQVLGLDTSSSEFSLFSNVILPAGISFFTFQLASIAIDRYRGNVPEMPSLKVITAYIGFFPQLVAGPILRFSDVAEALNNLTSMKLNRDAAARAIGYISMGLAYKVLIADTLDSFLYPFVSQPEALSVIASIYVVLAYSFQIYFDFYGYSLIAIGLGTLFGFHFPDNFRQPYNSLNPKEFWRRWHITLSFWIRDYLYYPLGGNRHYLRNIIIVFVVCGIWHGAGWNFIIWGGYHGILVACYHMIRERWDALPKFIQWTFNFSAVSFGWLLFVFDLDKGRHFMNSLAGLSVPMVDNPTFGMWFALIVSALVCFSVRTEKLSENKSTATLASLACNTGFAVLLILVLMFVDRSNTFIYFRF